jgi:hypothetical protein
MFSEGATPGQTIYHNQFIARDISSDAAGSHEVAFFEYLNEVYV